MAEHQELRLGGPDRKTQGGRTNEWSENSRLAAGREIESQRILVEKTLSHVWLHFPFFRQMSDSAVRDCSLVKRTKFWNRSKHSSEPNGSLLAPVQILVHRPLRQPICEESHEKVTVLTSPHWLFSENNHFLLTDCWLTVQWKIIAYSHHYMFNLILTLRKWNAEIFCVFQRSRLPVYNGTTTY